MSSPTDSTVTIVAIAGTDQWTWTRYYAALRPTLTADGLNDGGSQTVIFPLTSQTTYGTSDDALADAKSFNADLDADAFSVVS